MRNNTRASSVACLSLRPSIEPYIICWGQVEMGFRFARCQVDAEERQTIKSQFEEEGRYNIQATQGGSSSSVSGRTGKNLQ
jgi:hypothetical protein